MVCEMKKYIFIILLSCICLSACTKQDRENTIIDQEKSIDNYLASLDKDVIIVRNGGSSRVVVTAGEGPLIEAGDSVIFRYAGYIFSNGKGTLFVTNDTETAEKNDFITDGKSEKKIAGGKDLLPGLSAGMIGASQGEVCNIIFSAKYGYGNTVVYNVPKLSPLFFEIWIERVVKN